MPSVANVPEGLKYRKISVSEWLAVMVRNCILQKAAMEANAVEALDSDRIEDLHWRRC